MRPQRPTLCLATAIIAACGAEHPVEVAPPEAAAEGVYHAVAQYDPPLIERRSAEGVLQIQDGHHRVCNVADPREVWSSGPIEPGYKIGEALPRESGVRYVAPQPSGLLAIARPLAGYVELWEPAVDDAGCPPVDITDTEDLPDRQCEAGDALFPPGTVLESVGTGPQDWRRIVFGETYLVECGPEWRAHPVPYRWRSCDGAPALEVQLPAFVIEEVELRGPNRARVGHPHYGFRMEVIDASEGCGEAL